MVCNKFDHYTFWIAVLLKTQRNDAREARIRDPLVLCQAYSKCAGQTVLTGACIVHMKQGQVFLTLMPILCMFLLNNVSVSSCLFVFYYIQVFLIISASYESLVLIS